MNYEEDLDDVNEDKDKRDEEDRVEEGRIRILDKSIKYKEF